ncbi:aryl-alcohol-oxidase from pleurotus Eryingii, partial [Mycena pura]
MPMSLVLLSLCASALVHLARAGSIYTSPAQVTKKYDFIVVGAGTAGSVMAARLAESAAVNVLVIEAGGLDNTTMFGTIYTPLLAGTGAGTPIDWNYTSVAQAGLEQRTLAYPRGRVLGGSSAINGMIYSRGSRDEYDRLASVSGDPGWAWQNLEKYIMKNEQHTPPWNDRSNHGEFDPSWHGDGPLLTGLTPSPFELDNRVLQNARDFPELYPYNLDFNAGDGTGIGWLETSVGNGMRTTSASAYLQPAVNTRSNLDVLINTQVTKLVMTATKTAAKTAIKTFRGVQVAQSADAPTFTFTASKEVILSAGAIGTPQLLMLSGIGPKAQLAALGIKTALDVPDVGQNLQDQTFLALQWEVNGLFPTLTAFLDDPAALGAALAQWAADRTGPAAGNTVVNTVAFLRLAANASLLAGGDPAAGPASPHFQLAFLNTFVPNPGQPAPAPGGNWASVCVVLQCPTSRGALRLAAPSPFAHPAIDPRFYDTAFDMGVMVQALRALQAFFATPAFDGYFAAPAPEVAAALASDAAAEAYIRKYTDSLKHPTSTARISKADEAGGVVGPDLRVKGVAGLRVVDASILPSAPAGYPQAEIYIIAERAADLVKAAWNL